MSRRTKNEELESEEHSDSESDSDSVSESDSDSDSDANTIYDTDSESDANTIYDTESESESESDDEEIDGKIIVSYDNFNKKFIEKMKNDELNNIEINFEKEKDIREKFFDIVEIIQFSNNKKLYSLFIDSEVIDKEFDDMCTNVLINDVSNIKKIRTRGKNYIFQYELYCEIINNELIFNNVNSEILKQNIDKDIFIYFKIDEIKKIIVDGYLYQFIDLFHENGIELTFKNIDRSVFIDKYMANKKIDLKEDDMYIITIKNYKLGIENYGMTCYLNSLYHFINSIDGLIIGNKSLKEFLSKSPDEINSTDVFNLVHKKNMGIQNDSFEYLTHFMNLIKNKKEIISYDSKTEYFVNIDNQLYDIYINGNKKYKKEEMFYFPIIVKNDIDLIDNEYIQKLISGKKYFLNEHYKIEEGEIYKINDEETKIDDGAEVYENILVDNNPNYFIIYIQNYKVKNGSVIKRKGIKYENLEKEIFINNYKYEPMSIIYHTGSNFNSGHYVNRKVIDNEWYLFNDKNVNQKELTDDFTPYLIVYKNTGRKKITLRIKKIKK